METAHPSSIRPKSWRFQFGLRGLMLLLILSGLGLGGWRYWEKTRPQRELSAAINGCYELTEAEKDLLIAIVWKAKTTSSEPVPQPIDPWLQGEWEPIAAHSTTGRLESLMPLKSTLHFEKNEAIYLMDEEKAFPPPDRSFAECIYAQSNGQRYIKMKLLSSTYGVDFLYCLYDGSENIMLAHCLPLYRNDKSDIAYDDQGRPNPFLRSMIGAEGSGTFNIILRRKNDNNGPP